MAVILIIEDDAFIRQIAEMALQDSGYQTLAADGVEEALAFLNSDQIIDVLFTDIYLKKAALGGCDLATTAVCLRKPYADDQLRQSRLLPDVPHQPQRDRRLPCLRTGKRAMEYSRAPYPAVRRHPQPRLGREIRGRA